MFRPPRAPAPGRARSAGRSACAPLLKAASTLWIWFPTLSMTALIWSALPSCVPMKGSDFSDAHRVQGRVQRGLDRRQLRFQVVGIGGERVDATAIAASSRFSSRSKPEPRTQAVQAAVAVLAKGFDPACDAR